MPTYLQWFNVDWSWRELSEAERTAVRRAEALLQADPAGATADWLSEVLAEASARLPGRTVRAAVEDELDSIWIIEASAGQAELLQPEGARLEIFERLRDTSSRELLPVTLQTEDFRAAGIDKVARTLFFPKLVLSGIRKQAVRTDRSLSWMVQTAWSTARETILSLADSKALQAKMNKHLGDRRGQDSYAQSLFLGIEMISELDELARRFDCSQSQLLTLAWLESAATIDALPSSAED